MMLLSIVTINYNNSEGLKRTLKSVFSQTYNDFEYIVVDGKSTDKSVEIIQQHDHLITKWVSEPDNGIYAAQNKGIRMSSGTYLLFLNSGDTLIDTNTLEKIVSHLNGTDIVYGDLEIVESKKTWIKKYSQPVTFGYFLRDTLPHQASFITRRIIEKTGGGFNESLTIIADWKFFLDAVCRENASLRYVDEVISSYDYSGISSQPENQMKMLREKKKVLENEYARFYFELKELKVKYAQMSSARFVKIYFFIRNLFSSKKVILP